MRFGDWVHRFLIGDFIPGFPAIPRIGLPYFSIQGARDFHETGGVWYKRNVMHRNWRRWLRNFSIEIGVYAILVVIYFLLVLKFLSEPLTNLFNDNLKIYAILALFLIVGQGVLLELITSFLVERIGLGRRD